MPGPVSRHAARTQAIVAQSAFAALVVVGAGVLAMGLPGLRGAEAVPEPTLPQFELPAASQSTGLTLRPVDLGGVSQRLTLVSNSPKTQAPPDKPVEAAPPPPPPAETRFLGVMSMGSAKRALLVEGGRQKFVRVGDALADGSRVVEIHETSVVVESEAGVRRTIELAARSGDRVTRAVPNATFVSPSPAFSKGGGTTGAIRPATTTAAITSGDGKSLRISAGSGGGANTKPTARRPGTPDGSPERFEEIRTKLRSSGQFKSEDELNDRLKQLFEEESIAAEKRGNGS